MKSKKINHLVFWPPFLVLLGAVVLSLIDEAAFSSTMWATYDWVTDWFDWLYMLFALVAVVLLLIAFVSPWRHIKFGGEEAKPHYSTWSWFSMVLCSSVAIGIVFWGVAEPIYHLASPAQGIEPFSGEAVMFSISHNYLHWTLTVYAIYILSAIPIGLAIYNYKQKMTISSGLYFLLGEEKSQGKFGKIVDSLCVFALVGTLAASMGAGIMQITSGISFVTPLEPSIFVWLIVGLAIVVTFTLSSAIGLDKGMNFLSSQNVKLYLIILAFIFLVGPSKYILKIGVQGLGEYIQEFIPMHTYLGVDHNESWSRWWTVFYFAAWIAYGPVAGVFLTRISYGRSIKEFILVNLLAPSFFGYIWFTIFGGTAFDFQLTGKFDLAAVLTERGLESAVFTFFEQFPLGVLLIVVFLVVIFISFVTAADSMSSTVAILTTSGFDVDDVEPPLYLKVVWGSIIGILGWVMICFAGIDGAKMLAVVASLPMLFLMIMFTVSAVIGMNRSLASKAAVSDIAIAKDGSSEKYKK